MSRFSRSTSQGLGLLNQLKTIQSQSGSQFINQQNGSGVASLESLDDGRYNALATAKDGLAGLLSSAFASAAGPTAKLGGASLEAATIAGLAVGAPGTYRGAAQRAEAPSGLTLFNDAPMGAASMESFVPSLEAFNEQALDKYATFTIAFNMMAAKQSAWGEAFFPMIVATPDQAYFVAEIRRPTVWNGQVHERTGNRASWPKRNLVDALRDPEILKNNATDAIPFFDAAQNAAHFMPTTLGLAPKTIDMNGTPVLTHPLKAKLNKANFLGLVQNPGLIQQGVLNQTDEIDRNVRISTLYVTATKGGDTDLYAFQVSGNRSSEFLKAAQGHNQLVRSSFRDFDGLAIGADMKLVDGGAATVLAGMLSGETVRVEVGMDIDLHLESGNIDTSVRDASVASVYGVDGRKLDVASYAALSGVTFEVVGFDLSARRTNANRRTRGLILDIDGYKEAYTVGLLPPVVVQTPPAGENLSDDEKVKHLSIGVHIQMDNNAVATVLNYAETLKAFNTAAMSGLTVDINGGSLEGIGRFLVTPFYKEREIKLADGVSSLTSRDRVGDLRAYFTSLISQDVYEMFQQSGFLAAKQVVYGNTEGKDTVIIGTDQLLANYLMIQGDDRTAGPSFNVELVTTPNRTMYGKIIVAVADKNAKNELAPLGFGNCIYIPEFVSELPVNREGATVHEVAVQARFRHICNCPMMIVYTVTDLEDFIVDKTPVLMDNLEVVNP